MNEHELQQELDRLQAAGLNPMLCDTEIPLVDVPVLAGGPAEAGDSTTGQYVLLPRQLVGRHPVFLIDVDGLSMQDAGIMPGDRLEVQMDSTTVDGDIVVAEVDGGYTVKTLFTDDEGAKWLVPQNEEFDPILLAGHSWRIIGKVIGLRKGMPHTSYADCAKSVMRMRRQSLSTDQAAGSAMVDMPRNLVFKSYVNRRHLDFRTIREKVELVIVKQMRHRYEWYAAYRVMMDLKLLDDLKLSSFAQQMQEWFPDVAIRCNSDSLGDYAVGHTSKAFTLWSAEHFRAEIRKGQSMTGFNTLFHRCEELRAALYPLPVLELGLPF